MAGGRFKNVLKNSGIAPAYAKRLRRVNPPAADRGCGKPTLDG